MRMKERTSRKKVIVKFFEVGRRMFESSGFSKRWSRCGNKWVKSTDIGVQAVMNGVINDIRVKVNDNMGRGVQVRIVATKGM